MKNKDNPIFQMILEDEDLHREFLRENLIQQVTELISEQMVLQNISRSELAKRLSKSKSYVTQVLAGNKNLTLKTVSDLMFALDSSLQVFRKDADYELKSSSRMTLLPMEPEFQLQSTCGAFEELRFGD